MLNDIQKQALLAKLPDQQLQMLAQRPSPNLNPQDVMMEMNRRGQLRKSQEMQASAVAQQFSKGGKVQRFESGGRVRKATDTDKNRLAKEYRAYRMGNPRASKSFEDFAFDKGFTLTNVSDAPAPDLTEMDKRDPRQSPRDVQQELLLQRIKMGRLPQVADANTVGIGTLNPKASRDTVFNEDYGQTELDPNSRSFGSRIGDAVSQFRASAEDPEISKAIRGVQSGQPTQPAMPSGILGIGAAQTEDTAAEKQAWLAKQKAAQPQQPVAPAAPVTPAAPVAPAGAMQGSVASAPQAGIAALGGQDPLEKQRNQIEQAISAQSDAMAKMAKEMGDFYKGRMDQLKTDVAADKKAAIYRAMGQMGMALLAGEKIGTAGAMGAQQFFQQISEDKEKRAQVESKAFELGLKMFEVRAKELGVPLEAQKALYELAKDGESMRMAKNKDAREDRKATGDALLNKAQANYYNAKAKSEASVDNSLAVKPTDINRERDRATILLTRELKRAPTDAEIEARAVQLARQAKVMGLGIGASADTRSDEDILNQYGL